MKEDTQLQKDCKQVMQSYKMTFARYNFTTWEKKIVYTILRAKDIQDKIKNNIDLYLENNIKTYDEDFEVFKFKVSLSEISNEPNDYLNIKEALKRLAEKGFEFENNDEWEYSHIIDLPHIKKNTAKLTFCVSKKIYKMLVDISKGYRIYDFKVVMSLRSVYSMRFYELFCNQTENNDGVFYYKIEQLKEMFAIGNKYKTNFNFINRVVEVAKEELDERANFSFNYTPRKSSGSRAFDYIEFKVYHIPENEHNEELKENRTQNAISQQIRLSKVFYDTLQDYYKFTETEINSNIYTFYIAEQTYYKKFVEYGKNRALLMLFDKIDEVRNRALKTRVENEKGYIINALKSDMGIKNQEIAKERAEALTK